MLAHTTNTALTRQDPALPAVVVYKLHAASIQSARFFRWCRGEELGTPAVTARACPYNTVSLLLLSCSNAEGPVRPHYAPLPPRV
jgi:hypothetical protein